MGTLIIDFGLVVLIWMTQLIVYPSFEYFQEVDLRRWHKIYTSKISLLVLPLMLIQAVLYAYRFVFNFEWLDLFILVLLVAVWINTFFYAIPLHGKITEGKEVLRSARHLVRVNWYRTFLWTIIFLFNLWLFIQQESVLQVMLNINN